MNLDFCKKYSDHGSGFDYFYERVYDTTKLERCCVAEVGTREAGSTLLLLEAIKGTCNYVVTIDPYGKPYISGGNWPPMGEIMYQSGLKNISDYCRDNNTLCVPFRTTSETFMRIWDDYPMWKNGELLSKQFCVVYLDGEHTVEMVTKEMEWFIPRMRSNGLIVIDDTTYIKDGGTPIIDKALKYGIDNHNSLFVEVNCL